LLATGEDLRKQPLCQIKILMGDGGLGLPEFLVPLKQELSPFMTVSLVEVC
jgi:hypothetical protein